MRNLKKVIALVAVFAMLVSSFAFASTYSDVAETDNYARAIEVLNDLEIMIGDDEDGDGVMDFRPEDTITRAEVTAIIARIQGLDVAGTSATDFVDVPATHWASGYIAQAAKQGIVNGYGDGNFGPEDPVQYEQMLKMLMETLGYRPFADDNGGYPTGYVAAATRYGVLDDVIGGGVGAEAPRGMVAQMTYNAINAPIMDVVTYGNNKEYAVFDGSNAMLDYITLLSRDLKMVRMTGLVTENSYSGDIDTEAKKTIGFVPFYTVENAAYLNMVTEDDGSIDLDAYAQVLYQGEFDADSFLGYAVEMYAKKEDLFENIRTIKAIVKAGINDEVTFNLDQYVEKAEGTNGSVALKFSKNETSNATVSKTVQKNPTIIYNGVKAEEGLGAFFGGFITKNNNLSGQVTLMDADTVAGYEVVIIDAAVSAVVREVSANGQVRFFRPVQDPKDGTGIALVFDAEDTQSVIKLTKNGEEIDYTELKKWDVLSILWNGEKEYYDVKVLDADNYVDAIVSVVKSNSVVLSNGESYKVANNAYQFSLAEAQPGMSGRFYIDAYGKIVALDDTVAVEGATTTTDNYAYVLAAEPVTGQWSSDRDVINVMLLDKSGEVYDAQLANKVKFINLDKNDAIADLFTDEFQAGISKSVVADMTKDTVIDAANLDDLAAALVNTVIAYEGNSSREIKTIILGQTGDDERAMEILHKTVGGKTNDYNKDGLNFDDGDIFVNEDTVVFFIKGEDTIAYDGAGVASADLSSVGTIASLVDNAKYNVVAIGRDANDEAEVIVLLNEDGAYDQGANIAVIDSVGASVVNGADSVYTVAFYMNGELKTATTKVDMPAGYDFEYAQQGDIVKLALDGDTITMATEVLSFTRANAGFYTAAYGNGSAATAPLFNLNTGVEGEDEDFYFGAVTDFRTNGAAQVALMNEDGTATGAVKSVKEADASKVYVYDVDNKDEYRLSVGSIGDANADTDLNEAGSYVVLKKQPYPYFVETGLNNAIGMMDYVFVRYYNNAAADIVVYKNYDFGKYTIEDTAPVDPEAE